MVRPVVAGKMALGVVLFVLLAGTVGGMMYLKYVFLAGGGESVETAIDVLHPDGTLLFTGHVIALDGTPLGALLAAAEAAGFEVDVADHGDAKYVRSVAGLGEGGGGGWVYEVREDGPWTSPPFAADAFQLPEESRLRWRYSTSES